MSIPNMHGRGIVRTAGALLIFGSTVFAGTALPAPGYACDCAVPGSAQEALQQADAVFMGRVVGIRKVTKHAISTKETLNEVEMEVTATWKGADTARILVYTPWSSCQFPFTPGKDYLLYTRNWGQIENIVIDCGRSSEVALAQEDLRALGQGNAPAERDKPSYSDRQAYVLIAAIFALGAGLALWAFRGRGSRKKGS